MPVARFRAERKKIKKLAAEILCLEEETSDRTEQEDNTTLTKTTSFHEDNIEKSSFQVSYDKKIFHNFPKKDRVFEPQLKPKKKYFLRKYEKEMITDGNVY